MPSYSSSILLYSLRREKLYPVVVLLVLCNKSFKGENGFRKLEGKIGIGYGSFGQLEILRFFFFFFLFFYIWMKIRFQSVCEKFGFMTFYIVLLFF